MKRRRYKFGTGVREIWQFLLLELPLTLDFFDETWWEWSMGQAGRNGFDHFGFHHQGAGLLSAEGRKMGVLTVYKGL